MKKRIKTHRQPLSGVQVHDATWFGTPASMVFEAETTFNAATFPRESVIIRRESRIMKFIKNL